MVTLSIGLCNRIYDILVEHAGALEIERRRFVYCHSLEISLPSEWQFYSNLGFKGEFRIQQYDEMNVVCNKEDKTPERFKIIKKVNALLKEIYR